MIVQRLLYHFAFDPASRLARLSLAEKKMEFEERPVRYWEHSPELEALNDSGLLPVMVETDDRGRRLVACESRAVLDQIEERAPRPIPLWPQDPQDRAEAKRLVQWFERKFDFEVNALLLHEKMEKRLFGLGAPDLPAMRQGREALRRHMGYIEDLVHERDWLAGRYLSFADFAAAAHVSILDYFGEISWKDYPAAKLWYMKLKSRPAFRALLADRLPGVTPAEHYAELDF